MLSKEEQENKHFTMVYLICALAHMSDESAKGIIDLLTGHAWDQSVATELKELLLAI